MDSLMPISTSFDVLAFGVRILTSELPQPVTPRFRPAAVIYGEGNGLVSERSYDVITASDSVVLEHAFLAKRELSYA
jgi:hypothetical protein